MKRRPKFFLLGAPKCGTTALASYLAEHPLICASIPKEPHYFCKDLKAGGIPIRSDEEYLSTFFPGLDESPALAAIDCSVWYLYSEVAVEEILKFEPDARFLVMLRNPMKMAWSLFSMFTFQGQEDQKDLIRAWEMQPARKAGEDVPRGLWLDLKVLQYRDVCALGTQLKRVLGTLPAERVHVELQDDLKQDPGSLYRRVLEFMDVPDDGRVHFPRKNAGRKIDSPLIYSLLRSPLTTNAATALKAALGLRTLGFGRPDLKMPPHVHEFLLGELRNEIGLIEQLLGRNLPDWRHGEAHAA